MAASVRVDVPEDSPAAHAGSGESAARLLAEILHRPAWHADAACREHPDLSWFPTEGNAAAPRLVCASCLVQSECAAYAAAQGPTLQGVWAGLGPRQRSQQRDAAITGIPAPIRPRRRRSRR